MKPNNTTALYQYIDQAIEEDIGSGDHTTQACIPANKPAEAVLLLKDEGVLAGVEAAELVYQRIDPQLTFQQYKSDGERVEPGDEGFVLKGKAESILKGERLVLNCMQRMSGIATLTNRYVNKVKGLPVQVLDTRKTTLNFRLFEKWAVRIGGGENHRMGLYDMILIKDNHIDYSGGVQNAIRAVQRYLEKASLDLPVEIEARNMKEVKDILGIGRVQRILLDNFSPEDMRKAVQYIDGQVPTEASGNITLDNIRTYAETGVDYISVGGLTHSAPILDMSLKAQNEE